MIYPRFRDLRDDHDLVQKQAAAHLEIDQRVYSNYETGKREIFCAFACEIGGSLRYVDRLFAWENQSH